MYNKLNKNWQYHTFSDFTKAELRYHCNIIAKNLDEQHGCANIYSEIAYIIATLNEHTEHSVIQEKERAKQAKFEHKHRRLIKAINKKKENK